MNALGTVRYLGGNGDELLKLRCFEFSRQGRLTIAHRFNGEPATH